jgi:gluconokinase
MFEHQDNQESLPRRWVVMGVSGCGKSEIGARLAAQLGVTHSEGDADHPPANVEKMAAGIPLTDEDRQGWLLILQGRIRNAAEHDQGLVVSCSALKRRYRDTLRAGDPKLAFVHLDGERALIASRMQARSGHFMPVTLLDSQFRDLEPLQGDERGTRADIKQSPDAIIQSVMRHFQHEV